jgi:hypothetical protein
MSWLKTSVIAVVTLILMAFGSQAFAEHVDWSSYIDHSAPAKAPTAQPDNVVAQNDAPVAKSSKSKKRVAKKAPAKSKKKAARAKKRR